MAQMIPRWCSRAALVVATLVPRSGSACECMPTYVTRLFPSHVVGPDADAVMAEWDGAAPYAWFVDGGINMEVGGVAFWGLFLPAELTAMRDPQGPTMLPLAVRALLSTVACAGCVCPPREDLPGQVFYSTGDVTGIPGIMTGGPEPWRAALRFSDDLTTVALSYEFDEDRRWTVLFLTDDALQLADDLEP